MIILFLSCLCHVHTKHAYLTLIIYCKNCLKYIFISYHSSTFYSLLVCCIVHTLHIFLHIAYSKQVARIGKMVKRTCDLIFHLMKHIPRSNLCPPPISSPLRHLQCYWASWCPLHCVQDFHHQRTLDV